MKSRRWLRWLGSSIAAVLTAITVLAGCSAGGGSGSSGTTGNAGQTNQTANPSDKETKKSGSGLKGEVTIWTWEPEHKTMLEAFNKKYPDIKLKFVSVQASDVPKKLQTTIASGGELPDIIRIERGQRPKLLEMNVLENLEQAPYNVNKSLLFDYDIAVNRNAEGKLVSIPDDMSLAGIAYLKDLAKQYFGTDDPKQLEAMLPTWDVVIEKGKEISRNSGGKVKLFASLGDVWQIARGQRSGPFFDGDKLNTNVLGDVLNKIVKFRDADLVDKLDQFTPAWNASFGLDKYMFYPSPVWLPQYVIGPNDKTGKARWGLMVPPEGGFIWGGSGHGILKGAKNKEAAFKWIEFVSMTQDGAEALKKDGVFTHYKKAYDDPSFAEWKWQNFGDQNIGEKYFKDISAKTKDISENTNDTLLSEAMNIVLKTLAQDHSFTAEKAMDKIKQELKAKNAKITF